MNILLAIAVAWISVPLEVTAQERPTVTAGDRVRISSPRTGQEPVVGDVVARSSDTLTVSYWEPYDRGWETAELPIRSIHTLEVHRGTRTDAGKGALLGGLIGGGFGLAAGIAAASYDCDSTPWDWDGCWYWGRGELIPISTATFALVGAGVGALIGSASRREIWEPVPTGNLRLALTHSNGGVALALSVGF